MNRLGFWLMLAMVTALGVLGLVLAAHALDLGMTIFGTGLAIFATAFDFWLLKLYADLTYEKQA